jgi:hypothetical protein
MSACYVPCHVLDSIEDDDGEYHILYLQRVQR